MKKLIVCLIVLAASTAAARADQVASDAPLLNQANQSVNEQIFIKQKNGVLSDSDAARLQVRRQSIMQDAANRRSRNKGVLPTRDCSLLVKQMERLRNLVSRMN